MSSQSLVRVNQKLAQAKFLIDVLQEQNQFAEIKTNALIEAVCFHLYCAYQHYLREIAENYQLKIVNEIKSPQDLATLFSQKNKFPIEANEINHLLLDHSSWLSQLNASYLSLWQTPKPASSSVQLLDEAETVSVSLIPAVSVDRIETLVNLQSLDFWYQSFKQLVLRQRETSAEY